MSSLPVSTARKSVSVLVTLVVAGFAAGAFEWMNLPLPWMIGPLFTVAALRMLGFDLRALPGGRQAGQWAIGTALGLYFTPLTVKQLAGNAPLVVVVAVSALMFGVCCAFVMLRWARVDPQTAFFASLPGGASEMATIAERFDARLDRIAAAHSMRVMMVVSIVPFALTYAGVRGDDFYPSPAGGVDWFRFPWLVAAGLAGAGLLMLLRVANAWVLGPLLGVGLMTALEVPLSTLPGPIVNTGQLLIGCSLGSRFSPEFFRAAPRFMTVAALSSVLSMLLAFALALLLDSFSVVSLSSLSLATAPGGVAEMAITAKVLQLGVPLVTACHALRVIVLTLAARPAYRCFRRFVDDHWR